MFAFRPNEPAMRNVPLASVDAVPRPVLAIGTDYPPGTLLEMHSHRRAQLLYGATGLMEVGTSDGAWVVPPYSGVWIPAGKPHQVRMMGVSTRSLYIEPAAAPRIGEQCEVLKVSPLLRHLLLEAIEVPAEYQELGRDGLMMQLVLHEVSRAQPLPFFAPIPPEPRLAELCIAFLHQPNIQVSPGEWAKRLHKSERTFTRFFRQETGMSFGEWRQQACMLAALSRLGAGARVTAVALELGYDNPGAFSTLFRKRLGVSPSKFMEN